jgi:hypothetical protein
MLNYLQLVLLAIINVSLEDLRKHEPIATAYQGYETSSLYTQLQRTANCGAAIRKQTAVLWFTDRD